MKTTSDTDGFCYDYYTKSVLPAKELFSFAQFLLPVFQKTPPSIIFVGFPWLYFTAPGRN